MSDAYRRLVEGERVETSPGLHARATLAQLRARRGGPRDGLPPPVVYIPDAMTPGRQEVWRPVGALSGEKTVYELSERRNALPAR